LLLFNSDVKEVDLSWRVHQQKLRNWDQSVI
jgi:hypothetical protein